MRSFISYDGPLITLLSRFWNCVWLTVLFALCSIPVVTMGMSYSALYFTLRKTMRNERDYVTPTFFKAFVSNWRQGLAAGAIFLGVGVLLFLDYHILHGLTAAGLAAGGFSVAVLAAGYLLLLYALWVFAYLSRFQDRLGTVFRNSALLAVSNGGKTVLAGLILALAGLICYMEPILTALLPSVAVWLISGMLEKAFRASMSPEQLAADDAENSAWTEAARERRERRKKAREERRARKLL